MVWQQIAIIAYLIVGIIANIAIIGKPREPLTPGGAISALVAGLVLIALVMTI